MRNITPFYWMKLDENAVSPTHNNKGDAGVDFYALEYVELPPHDYKVIKTGIRVELPEGYVGLLFPKGKNDHLLGAGVVDTFYEGEILFKVVNPYDWGYIIRKGYPIGQMIVVPFREPYPIEVYSMKSRDSGRKDTGGIKKDLNVVYK